MHAIMALRAVLESRLEKSGSAGAPRAPGVVMGVGVTVVPSRAAVHFSDAVAGAPPYGTASTVPPSSALSAPGTNPRTGGRGWSD